MNVVPLNAWTLNNASTAWKNSCSHECCLGKGIHLLIPPCPYNSHRPSISAHFLSATSNRNSNNPLGWHSAATKMPQIRPVTCAEMSIVIAPASVPPKLTANDRRINVSKILKAEFGIAKRTVQVSVEGQSPIKCLVFSPGRQHEIAISIPSCEGGNLKLIKRHHRTRCPNDHCSKLPIALHDRCCHSPTALAQAPPAPSRMEDMWHIAKHLSSKTNILLIDKTPRTTWDC